MVRLVPAISLVLRYHLIELQCKKKVQPLLSCTPVITGFHRSAHSQYINKNMMYISNDQVKLRADPKTLKLDKDREKSLCIIMNWMMSKPKHVMKYAELYLEQEFDVVSVSCTPWQLMWPVKGSQVIAGNLMKFMEVNSHTPIVVHGFSVGAYVWAELLVLATSNKGRYQPVLDRVKAQLWDSPADIYEIPVGLPIAVFPNNRILQESFRAYIKLHMRVFDKMATQYYRRATREYHATPCRAPAQFLLSSVDPVGAEKRSRTAHDAWLQLGIKCNWKCWSDSPHVSHYMYHPKEYTEAVFSHLNECGLLRHPDIMKKRFCS